MRKALMVGISGNVGKALLEALLNNRNYKKVIVLTRRENQRIKNIHMQKVTVDFSTIENHQEEFDGVDDVFCLLGTDYINTLKLEDAPMFEYEYPLGIAKVARQNGVKNFFLINPTSANLNSVKEKYKLRAKLADDITNLGFDNFYIFKVNRVGKPVDMNSSLFAVRKSLGSLVNLISLGMVNKIKGTPANLLVSKMIKVAISNPLEKKEFLPKDY